MPPASPTPQADARQPSTPPKDAPAEEPAACAYWDFCPNCGGRLVNQGCKYRCPRCHYFMSCSDFD